MSDTDPAKSLTDLAEPGTTLMVATQTPTGVDSRPLTVAGVDGARLSILLDTTADWVAALTDGDWVHATISDTRKNDYASMTGTLAVSHDRARIDELWNPFAGAYFPDGKESDGIAILDLIIDEGSYWDAPNGRIGSMISLVRAKLGSGEDAGEHGDIAV